MDRLEVLLADGGSTDASCDIIHRFQDCLNVRILDNSIKRTAEWGKGVAISHAAGELIQCIDADMWTDDKTLLRRLATPLATDEELAGSIPRMVFIAI